MTAILDPSYKVPGTYIKVSLGVGPQSPGSAPRKVLLYGNKTSAGSMTVGIVYPVDSVDTARSLAGPGSELARLAASALAANGACPLYMIAVTESAGTAASNTIVFATNASAAGTVVVQLEEKIFNVAVASGDTPTAIAAAVAAAIETWTDRPATAGASSGTVTLTARHKGPRGNAIAYFAYLDGVTGTTVTNTGTRLTSGATSDDPQTALDSILADRYHYHVAPYFDAANLAKFAAHVTTTAGPTVGLRELVVSGSYDTPGTVNTLGTTLNEARAQIVWQEGSWLTPGELAAGMAAVRSLEENADPAVNLDGVIISGIPTRRLAADRPTANEQNTALNAGITPLVDTNAGKVAIVRSVTTHTKDSSSNPDYRVLDTAKVVVADFVADDLAINWPSFVANSGAKIAATPTDGSAPAPGVTTPAMARDWIYGRLRDHEGRGVLENVDTLAPQLAVTLSTVTAGRLEATIPIDVIELLHQLAADVRQVA